MIICPVVRRTSTVVETSTNPPLRAAQEAQRVPEEVSRFLAPTAEVQLQQPEITGLAVPVAFTLHVPVQRDGECEYEHYGGVLQEEATK